MKKGKMITELSYIKDYRSFNALVLNFDLPVLINKMKRENASKNGEPLAKVLLNSHYKQILLAILHESTEIDSFQENDSVSFQLVEGKLKFRTRKESVLLEKGQILVLNENVKYRLISNEETVFIITLTNNASKLYKN